MLSEANGENGLESEARGVKASSHQLCLFAFIIKNYKFLERNSK